MIRKLVLLFLVLMLSVGCAQATDYYVSPNGAGNALTPSTPGDASIVDAELDAGDTLYFLDGVYTNENVVLTASGTEENPIILTAYNGTPTLTGNNLSTAITLQNYCNVSNLKIQNYGVSVYANTKTGLNISYNEIHVPPKIISGVAVYKYGPYLITTNNSKINNNSIIMDINAESLAGAAGCAGVWISGNNSDVSNNTVEGHAHNSICLVGLADGETTAKLSTNLTVRNNYVANNSVHGGMDIAGDINDLWIENNTFFRASALYVHKQSIGSYRVHFNNNTVTDASRTDFMWVRDSEACNNTIVNATGDAFYNYVNVPKIDSLERPVNLTLRDNLFVNTTGYTVRMSARSEAGTRGDVLYINNRGSNKKYAFEGITTNAIVRFDGYQPEKFNIITQSNSTSTVEFLDNRLFKITKTYGYENHTTINPLWYPDKSNFSVISLANSGWGYDVTSYPLTITPTTDTVSVSSIGTFNLDLPAGSTIMSITADSTDGNVVDFVLSDLTTNAVYSIYRDGELVSTQNADENGEITWNNSAWSEHTFTVVYDSGEAVYCSRQVSGSADDAYEQGAGYFSKTLTSVIVQSNPDSGSDGYIAGGVRFQNITIPKGATVTAAYLQLNVYDATYDNPNMTIYGNDHDNSPDFTEGANIISRTRTDSGVSWVDSNVALGWVQSPDLKTIAQEIIDREGWQSGNNITLLLIPDVGTQISIRAKSYDADPTLAPKLYIEYETDAPPVAQFISNVTSGTVPLTVQFTDSSSGDPTAWSWDIDNDGTEDYTTQNATHVYSTAGTYSVNLTVTNAAGTDSELKELYISANNPSLITQMMNSFWYWWGARWQLTYWLEVV